MQKAAPAAAIDGVTLAYVNRNVAPEIEGISVADPAVMFISAAYPSAPQVVEATNPDEYGMFSSLDTPRERAPAEQGKRMFRKGFRTVIWRASRRQQRLAPLLRSPSARRGGTSWLRLRENIDETQLNFDTSQLPDGRYELRLTATDAPDNPDAALTDVKDGVEFQVDNIAPKIAVSRRRSGDVLVRITDEALADGARGVLVGCGEVDPSHAGRRAGGFAR